MCMLQVQKPPQEPLGTAVGQHIKLTLITTTITESVKQTRTTTHVVCGYSSCHNMQYPSNSNTFNASLGRPKMHCWSGTHALQGLFLQHRQLSSSQLCLTHPSSCMSDTACTARRSRPGCALHTALLLPDIQQLHLQVTSAALPSWCRPSTDAKVHYNLILMIMQNLPGRPHIPSPAHKQVGSDKIEI